MQLLIEHVAHHRNGVCGAPFHAVLFRDADEGRMLGIIFDADHHVAVFNLDKLDRGNIAFGVNSWRGDLYEPSLRRLVRQHLPTDTEPATHIVPPPASWTAEYNPYAGHNGRDTADFTWRAYGGYLGTRTADGPVVETPPADRNATRAGRFGQVLALCHSTGSGQEMLIDLLADAMHWCDAGGEDFHIALAQACRHYIHELNDEQHDERRL